MPRPVRSILFHRESFELTALITLMILTLLVAFVFSRAIVPVFAANTVSSAEYLDTDNDGSVDHIKLTFDENITQCTYEAGDWTVNTAGDFNISITGISAADPEGTGEGDCDGSDAVVYVIVNADAAETGSATDPVISYDNDDTNDSLQDSGVITDKLNITVADSAKPVIESITFTTYSVGDVFNAVLINYTERIFISLDGDGGDDGSGPHDTTTTIGAMTTARTLAGILSWSATDGGDMTTSSETGNRIFTSGATITDEIRVLLNFDPTAFFNGGTTAPTTPSTYLAIEDAGIVFDAAGNPVNSANTSATISNPTAWDVSAPTISNTYSCDVDGNGKIDRIQVTFDQAIWDDTVDVANFEGDVDDTNDGTGEVVPSSFSTQSGGCDGLGNDVGPDDDKIRFDFTTELDTTDIVYLHNAIAGLRDEAGNRLATGDALGTEVDKADPKIVTAQYFDDDGNGRVDQIELGFSEGVSQFSVLAQRDLTFSNDGDFDGLQFTASTTDLITVNGTTSVLMDVDEATVIDTAEDSTDIEITTQSSFVLTDLNGNSDNVEQAQGQITYVDMAGVVIESTSPLDGGILKPLDKDIVITFSEEMDTSTIDDLSIDFDVDPDPGGIEDPLTAFTLDSAGRTVMTIEHDNFTNLDEVTVYIFDGALALDGSGNDFFGPDFSFTFTARKASSGGGGGTVSQPSTTPMIALTDPMAGDSLQLESFFDVYYEISGLGIDSVDLELQDENGTTFKLATGLSTTGSPASVQVPSGAATGDARLTARAYDSGKAVLDSDTIDIEIVALELTSCNPGFELVGGACEPIPTLSDDEINAGVAFDSEGRKIAPLSGETALSPWDNQPEAVSSVLPGWYVRSYNYATVYYIDQDMNRHAFWDAQTFMTWAQSWDEVIWVTDATLGTLPLAKPMLPKPSVVFVKIQSDPRVYHVEVDVDGAYLLRHVTSETVMIDLLGANWSDYIIDVDPGIFQNYRMGDSIGSVSEFDGTYNWTRRQVIENRVNS